jgi:hypothetical protein
MQAAAVAALQVLTEWAAKVEPEAVVMAEEVVVAAAAELPAAMEPAGEMAAAAATTPQVQEREPATATLETRARMVVAVLVEPMASLAEVAAPARIFTRQVRSALVAAAEGVETLLTELMAVITAPAGAVPVTAPAVVLALKVSSS